MSPTYDGSAIIESCISHKLHLILFSFRNTVALTGAFQQLCPHSFSEIIFVWNIIINPVSLASCSAFTGDIQLKELVG